MRRPRWGGDTRYGEIVRSAVRSRHREPQARDGDRARGRRDRLVLLLAGGRVAAAVVLTYLGGAGEPGGAAHGRAVALATLTLGSAFLAAALSRLRTVTAWTVVALTVTSTVVLVQVPALARLLHLAPLDAGDWAVALAGAAPPLLPLGLATAGARRQTERRGG